MHLFHIMQPDYGYTPRSHFPQTFWVNGQLDTHLILPYVTCPACEEAWDAQSVPITLPQQMADEVARLKLESARRFRAGGSSHISYEEFSLLATRWEAMLQNEGISLKLKPGMTFGPFEWYLPSIPRDDVFWCNGYYVFRDSVIRAMDQSVRQDINVFALSIAKMGVYKADAPPPRIRAGNIHEFLS